MIARRSRRQHRASLVELDPWSVARRKWLASRSSDLLAIIQEGCRENRSKQKALLSLVRKTVQWDFGMVSLVCVIFKFDQGNVGDIRKYPIRLLMPS